VPASTRCDRRCTFWHVISKAPNENSAIQFLQKLLTRQHKSLLRQQLVREVTHAAGHRYSYAAGGCRAVKALSGRNRLNPGSDDVDDGGCEDSGSEQCCNDCNWKCLAHDSLLPQLQTLEPIARARCDRRHKISLFGASAAKLLATQQCRCFDCCVPPIRLGPALRRAGLIFWRE
jgi:hypothetical protein